MTRVASKSKTTKNRSCGRWNYASHEDHAQNSAWDSPGSILEGLGRSWPLLGRYLASFGALFGGSGSFLDASWVSPGRFLGPLGRLLANLRRLLSASWLSGPPRASILEGLEACWAGFGRASSMSFPAPRASSRNAFIHAMTTILHLPALFLHPFRCGGLCAALGIHSLNYWTAIHRLLVIH